MAPRVTMEVKVGVFILSGVLLLVVFVSAIGDLSTYFQPGYLLRIMFDTANGITDGSPVQYAGVEVGKVQRVSLVRLPERVQPSVELQIHLPSTVQVREDDVATIST